MATEVMTTNRAALLYKLIVLVITKHTEQRHLANRVLGPWLATIGSIPALLALAASVIAFS